MKQRSYKELTPIDYDDLLYGGVLRNLGDRPDKRCFAKHYHERVELMRMLRGRMEVHIDDRIFEAQAGDLIIVNPNQSHAGYALSDSVDFDSIAFELGSLNNNSFFYQKYLEPLLNQRIAFANVTAHPDVIRVVDELIRAYREKRAVHPLHKIGLIYHLLGLFFQHCGVEQLPMAGHVTIDIITAYIDEHFNEPLSVKELSRRFGYNENYFSRMFKKSTEMSVTQYIQSLRLERAKKLLRETDESVTAIALLCGYSDVFYFSNRFKLYTAEAPQQYRKHYRTKEIAREGNG